jgi:hypothetical protein
MEDGHDADLATDVVWIGGQFGQSLGSGLHQEGIQGLLVGAQQIAELVGDGEDDVEVRHGQEFLAATREPGLGIFAVALGTRPVAAGVIDVLLPAAVVTDVELATQGWAAAMAKVQERPTVAGEHALAETLDIPVAVETEDVGHLRHGELSEAATGRP